MKLLNKKMFILVTLCILLTPVYSLGQFFLFQREIKCIHENSKGHCNIWNETTSLYRNSNFAYFCFPGDLYVLTQNGPKQMKNLQLGDQIFAMNLQSGKNQFTQVSAWLHHDAESMIDFRQITLQNSDLKYISSDFHNIAYANDKQADFKFLKDLNKGDSLISFSSSNQQFLVDTIDKKIQKMGLYSPLTQSGTFYIFPQSFDEQSYNKNAQAFPMILVHSLSQINNPTKNFIVAQIYFSLISFFIDQYQPTDQQEYINPLMNHFSYIFMHDYVEVSGNKIHSRSSATSGNQKREERKRKTIAVLAMQSILKDVLL